MSADAPAEIRDLARARSAARSARDWSEADRLKAEIEAAGWKVVDRAGGYELEPGGLPDLVDGERVRHGRSGSVPSRLAEPASAPASLVIVPPDGPGAAALDPLTAVPNGTQVVVVTAADAPPDQPSETVEEVWLAAGLGPGAAANAGIRRAVGDIVVLAGRSAIAAGTNVGSIVEALADPTVAVAGDHGLVSADLRAWQDAPSGDVAALGPGLLAFRRDDFVARGPLDERFDTFEALAIWWSLVLRDGGDIGPLRRAVVPAGQTGGGSVDPGADVPSASPVMRLERRDFYRLVRRFGQGTELLTGAWGRRRLP